MSLAAMHWAKNRLTWRLPIQQGPRLALLLLAIEADVNGTAMLSIEELAERMGASVRSAQRATRELGLAGLIDIEHRFDSDGTQLPNNYHLLMDT